MCPQVVAAARLAALGYEGGVMELAAGVSLAKSVMDALTGLF
jgi:hypothetical protein